MIRPKILDPVEYQVSDKHYLTLLPIVFEIPEDQKVIGDPLNIIIEGIIFRNSYTYYKVVENKNDIGRKTKKQLREEKKKQQKK
jgi:hypothetical protein